VIESGENEVGSLVYAGNVPV